MTQRGFTLIELTVGVSIMIGVLAGAYLCLSAGYRSREAIEQHSDLLQRGRAAIDLITRDLRHASPTSPELRFVGMNRERDETQADNLDFVTHNWTPTHPEHSDLCEVSYFVDVDAREPGVLNLYRRRDPSPDLEPFAGGSRELIARDIAGFRLEYYDGFEWLDGWDPDGDGEERPPEPIDPEPTDEEDPDAPPVNPYTPGQSGLPEAIRVTIAFRDQRPRQRNASPARSDRTQPASEEASMDSEFDAGDSADDPSGVIVVQSVVRPTLTHRTRALPGGAGMTGPFDATDPDNPDASIIDDNVDFEGINR